MKKQHYISQLLITLDLIGPNSLDLLLLSFLFTDLPPTEPSGFPGVCPEDQYASVTDKNNPWVPHKGYCYKFVTEIKTWSESAASCVKHGKSYLLYWETISFQ